jgi:site-specific recombinase XerD
MARPIHRLAEPWLKNAKNKEPGLYPDGGNLWFRVKPGGTESWVFRFTIAKRTRDAGLGAYPAVTLMLRHSCGYHLANLSQVPDLRLIQDYLGHKNIKNTARYTRTSARRFEGLWD